MLQLFSAPALHAARGRQTEELVKAGRPQKERLARALDTSMRALRNDEPGIEGHYRVYLFVVKRFLEAGHQGVTGMAMALVVTRFLLALPLAACRAYPLEERLLANWYRFRKNPDGEDAWRTESLARTAPRLIALLDYDLQITKDRFRLDASHTAFVRTLVHTVIRTVQEVRGAST
jgi:hypothetical protein